MMPSTAINIQMDDKEKTTAALGPITLCAKETVYSREITCEDLEKHALTGKWFATKIC
jgi:hypothetical protein